MNIFTTKRKIITMQKALLISIIIMTIIKLETIIPIMERTISFPLQVVLQMIKKKKNGYKKYIN